jgi:ribosomal protein L16/L10AE
MSPIILNEPIELMTTSQQEEIWVLSRTNEVYVRDVNGELFQVLDLTNGKTDKIRTGKQTKPSQKETKVMEKSEQKDDRNGSKNKNKAKDRLLEADAARRISNRVVKKEGDFELPIIQSLPIGGTLRVTLYPRNPITRCEIWQRMSEDGGFVLLGYGLGVRKNGDEYDAMIGIKKSVASAMRRCHISKHSRTVVWELLDNIFPR